MWHKEPCVWFTKCFYDNLFIIIVNKARLTVHQETVGIENLLCEKPLTSISQTQTHKPMEQPEKQKKQGKEVLLEISHFIFHWLSLGTAESILAKSKT